MISAKCKQSFYCTMYIATYTKNYLALYLRRWSTLRRAKLGSSSLFAFHQLRGFSLFAISISVACKESHASALQGTVSLNLGITVVNDANSVYYYYVYCFVLIVSFIKGGRVQKKFNFLLELIMSQS